MKEHDITPVLVNAPSPPACISVGVETTPRTFVSRGVLVSFDEFLPPEIVEFFNSTQMQTQATQAFPPVRLSEEVISVTESDSEPERPHIRTRTRFHSPEIVPETQVESDGSTDEEFRIRLLLLSHILY
jgi:hypothetical protein